MNAALPKEQTRTDERTRTDEPRQWAVVLLDDDEHSYEYVIEMMQSVFAHTVQRALAIAKKVDGEGRAVCMITHRELAELKQEQIHSFGRDARIAECAGAMSAILEPASEDVPDEDDELD
ncbi:MAG: ATP-dependent Clp protease adaptor ClpS [Phycisphaerales bacterium JB043]